MHGHLKNIERRGRIITSMPGDHMMRNINPAALAGLSGNRRFHGVKSLARRSLRITMKDGGCRRHAACKPPMADRLSPTTPDSHPEPTTMPLEDHRRVPPKSFALLMAVTICGVSLPQQAQAELNAAEHRAGKITVTLESGRIFSGYVDKRTSEERLWLRFEAASTEILRPIRWHRVKRVQVAGRTLTVAELRTQVDRYASPGKLRQDFADVGRVSTGETSYADHAVHALDARAPVAGVEIDAYLSNWDRDVEPDGLVVTLDAFDKAGRPAAVSGHIDATLIAQRRRDFNAVPTRRGTSFDRIGRWVRAFDADDDTSGRLAFRLPFQADHPAFDTRIQPHAVVHVRVTIPGRGVYERTIDPVRIRAFSPVRDGYQLSTGRRFFPIERTERGQRTER